MRIITELLQLTLFDLFHYTLQEKQILKTGNALQGLRLKVRVLSKIKTQHYCTIYEYVSLMTFQSF